MDLLEVSSKHEMRREEAAKLLHYIADSLARQNSLQFKREGKSFAVRVADQVEIEVELEVEDDNSSLEIEIKW